MAIYEKGLIRTDRGLFLDKGNQAIDPRHPDFAGGAVGDGVHDDRPAIVAADAYATEISAGLVFGPGTYKVDTDLTIVNEIDLMTGASFTGSGTVTYTERSGGSSSLDVFRPEDYGAVGDGVTDDYQAFQDLAAAVNAAGAGVVSLGRNKTYYIGQYTDGTGATWNGVDNVKFQDLSSLTIDGSGSTIAVKGDFNRGQDNDLGGGLWQSYSQTVIPIYVKGCNNVRIHDLELDGNVDLMTRSAGVIEGPLYGIYVYDTNNFILENIHVHHFGTDGILLGPINVVENGMLANVRSAYNARQGMSIIHARNITCIGCVFEETQNAAGAYGSHAPGAGVDIEPDSAHTSSDITFIRCRFYNNAACFFSLSPAVVSNVALRDCVFDAGVSTIAYQVIAGSNGVHFDNCAFDLGGGHLQIGDATWGSLDLQWVTVRGGYVRSTGYGILSDTQVKSVVENVEIIGTWTAPSTQLQPYLSNGLMRVHGCRVFRPAASYSGGGSYQVVDLWNVQESYNNQFETDLVATTSEHFANNYPVAVAAHNDRFLPVDTVAFRPSFNSTWPAGFPYSTIKPFRLEGGSAIFTPSVDQNDYELGSDGLTAIARIYPGASNVNITGFADGVEGRVVLIQQIGDLGRTVTLKHQSTSSTAGNRIATPGATDLVLSDGEGVTIWYDGSSGVWRVISK